MLFLHSLVILEAADLLHNLSLDPETMAKVPDTGNKVSVSLKLLSSLLETSGNPFILQDVYGGTKSGKTNLLPTNVRAVTGLNQKKLAFNQKGSYGTYPTGYYTPPYQYPRYGYDMNYASGKTNSTLQYPHLVGSIIVHHINNNFVLSFVWFYGRVHIRDDQEAMASPSDTTWTACTQCMGLT